MISFTRRTPVAVFSSFFSTSVATKNIVVVGGAGVLGDAVLSSTRSQGFNTISIDYRPTQSAERNIVVPKNVDWSGQVSRVKADLVEMLKSKETDILFHTAGAWSGGSICDENVIKSIESLWESNAKSAIMAAHLGALTVKRGGLLVLTGAAAATSPCPGMIGYGISKCVVHFLVKNLAAEKKIIDKNICVLGILPKVIDTPINRSWTPYGDYSTWTKPTEIANKLIQWTSEEGSRFPSGSLLVINTVNDSTTEWIVHNA